MTDTRFQRDLNSLIKVNRRQRLDPAPARLPVSGGIGYAGASEPEPLALDQIYMGYDTGVFIAGEPDPLETPRLVVDNNAASVFTAVTAGDLYEARRGTTWNDDIRKNGEPLALGIEQAQGFTTNTTEILVIDAMSVSAAPDEVRVYDRFSGELLRSITGPQTWNSGFAVPHFIAANDTHFAFTVDDNGTDDYRLGAWLFQANLTPVIRLALEADEEKSFVCFTADRLYHICATTAQGIRIHIYDLVGTLLDSQTWGADVTWADNINGYEVTAWGLWQVGWMGGAEGPGRITYYARGAGELFDEGSKQQVDTPPVSNPAWTLNNLWGCSKDRDFGLEY